MDKKLLYVLCVFFIVSCNTKRKVEVALNSGNYDHAINAAVSKLQVNKNKKSKATYVAVLHDAFLKARTRDLNEIKILTRENNPDKLQQVYNIYLTLMNRQEKIAPLLPLKYNGRKLDFKFKDYTEGFLQAKSKLAEHLYLKGIDLMQTNNKPEVRTAYKTLKYLDDIYPNYKDARSHLSEAYENGRENILVSVINETDQIIPERLQNDLLELETYDLESFWKIYHSSVQDDVDYDYAIELLIKDIVISPETINTLASPRSRTVSDGWKYVLDARGNVAKDSSGNDIKEERIIEVKGTVYETVQSKTADLYAEVIYKDLKTNEPLDRFNLQSNFLFLNKFSRLEGDKRVLNKEDLEFINNEQLYFPSNEKMIYDTGEDLKLKLKAILQSSIN